MMRTQPLMIDVDTGVDDAAAMALAIGLRAKLVAVSSVAGNVPVDLATDNSLRVLSLLGMSDIPVFRGASRPLVATYQDATQVHGGNGLGGAQLLPSPVAEASMSGPEAILVMADRYDGELALVMVGPLTNLAIALSLRPRITRQIATLVIMGGAYFGPGNTTEHAEFNIYIDPDAGNQVFAAPWDDVTVVGLDVTHQIAITQKMWEMIPAEATGAAGLMRDISARTFIERSRSGFFLHDPLAVGVALDPTLVSGKRYAINVSVDNETRGKTTLSEGGSILVASEIRATTFIERFCDALGMPHVLDAEGLANAE